MGKRKSSAKAAPKTKKEPLSTVFKCLFCNHEKTVVVKLDRSTMFGSLHCKDCGQKFSTPINTHVDVYSDWVDACEEIRSKQPERSRPQRPVDPLAHGSAGGARMTLQSDHATRPGKSREGVLDQLDDEDEDDVDADRGVVVDDDEEDDVDDEADYDDARARRKEKNGRNGSKHRDRNRDEEEEEEEEAVESADEDEDRGERRKRVRMDDPDEDSD